MEKLGKKKLDMQKLLAPAALVILYIVFSIFGNNFLSLDMVKNILESSYYIGFMAFGVTFIIITGGIDLSLGTVMMCAALLGGYVFKQGWPLILAIALTLFVGIAFGFVNGVLIAKLKIPPILATLGTGELFSGIGIVLTGGSAISDFPATYAYLINNRIAGIPVQFLIFAVGAVVLWFLLSRTTYGKKLTLLGSSENVARFSGLNVDWILVKTYLISGIYAAAGGMIMLANYNSARADYGSNYTLQCILIVVLGGVSPNGGKGKIGGVLLSIFLVRALETGLNRFPQISSYYISLVWGAVLLLVMVLDYLNEHKRIKA